MGSSARGRGFGFLGLTLGGFSLLVRIAFHDGLWSALRLLDPDPR